MGTTETLGYPYPDVTDAPNVPEHLQALAEAVEALAIPRGTINPYAGSAAPAGWLLCYGQVISVTTYAALYAVVGNAYNPNTGQQVDISGNATVDGGYFKVPDLRGRTIAALDNMGGSDAGRLDWANTLGTAGGAQTHTLTSGESGLPAHAHSIDHDHASFNATSGGMSANQSHNHNSFYNSDPRTGSIGGDMIAMGSNSNMAWRTVYPGMADADLAHTHTTTIDVPAFSGTSGNNSAANASSAHNNMQPTMLMNYIIKV